MLKLPYRQQSRPIAVRNLFEQVVSDLSETAPVVPPRLPVANNFPSPDTIQKLISTKDDLVTRAELTMPDKVSLLDRLPETITGPMIEEVNRLNQQIFPKFLDANGVWHDKDPSTRFTDIAESLRTCQNLLDDFAFEDSVDIPMVVAAMTTLLQDVLSKDLLVLAETVLASAHAQGLELPLRSSLMARSDDLSALGNMDTLRFLTEAVNRNTLRPISRDLIGRSLAHTDRTFFEKTSADELLNTINEINPDWLDSSSAEVTDISVLAQADLDVRRHLLDNTDSSYRTVLAASLSKRNFSGGHWRQG